jgi:hypothetical protein
MSTNPAVDELLEFFDRIWGDAEGYAYLPVKESTGRLRKMFLRWPEQREAVPKHVLKHAANPEAEVFFSPALFKSMKPEQDNVLGSNVVWADFDGNAPTEWTSEIVPQPTIEVQSSTEKKRHVYWVLDEFCDDRKTLERINRSIAYALQADLSGWDASQFLRPPYSVNRKYDKPITAKVLVDRLENAYELSAFSEIPAPAETIKAELELGELPTIDEVKSLAKWDKEMLSIFNKTYEEMAGPNHDRSGALQRLAYFGAEKQWTDEQIMAVLLDADDRWKKYSARASRDRILAELINRARAKHGYEKVTFDGLLKGLQTQPENAADDSEHIYSVRELAVLPGIEDWVIEGMLIPSGLGLFTGRPGVGKTQCTFQMAADLATGREQFIEWELDGQPRKVLFMSLEMGAHQLGHIMKPLSERYPEKTLEQNLIVHAQGNPLPLDEESGQAYFVSLLDRFQPEVVMIDSLSLAAAGDVTSDKEMKAMFDFLKVARNIYNFALVIVHHHRKKANDAQSKKRPDDQSDIYGSYIVSQAIDFALNLEEIGTDFDNGEITMSMLKNRFAPIPQPFKVARSSKLHFSKNTVNFDTSSLLSGIAGNA